MNQNKAKGIDFWAIILIDGEEDEKEEKKDRTNFCLRTSWKQTKERENETDMKWQKIHFFALFSKKNTSDFILKSWSMVYCNWYKHKQSNVKKAFTFRNWRK